MVDPDHEILPTPPMMGQRQRDKYARAVDLIVEQWNNALSQQVAAGTTVGTILLDERMTAAHRDAVQRFRENGWSVLIRRSFSRFPMPATRIVFAPALSFNVNVPMPAGVSSPRIATAQRPSGDSPATDPGPQIIVPPGPSDMLARQQRNFEDNVQLMINYWLKQLEVQSPPANSWGTLDDLEWPLSAVDEEVVKRFERAGWSVQRRRVLSKRGHIGWRTRLSFGSKPDPAEPSNPVYR